MANSTGTRAMEAELCLESKLASLMYAQLGVARSNLVNGIIAAVESINLVNPFFSFNKIHDLGEHFISRQKEVIYFERLLQGL